MRLLLTLALFVFMALPVQAQTSKYPADVLDVTEAGSLLLDINIWLDSKRRKMVHVEGLDFPERCVSSRTRTTRRWAALTVFRELIGTRVSVVDPREDSKHGLVANIELLDGRDLTDVMIDAGLTHDAGITDC